MKDKIFVGNLSTKEINSKIAKIKKITESESQLKNWSENLENAFELFKEMPGVPCLNYYGNYIESIIDEKDKEEFSKKPFCCVNYFNYVGDHGCAYYGKTAAEAICKSWIHWKTAEASQTHNPQSL